MTLKLFNGNSVYVNSGFKEIKCGSTHWLFNLWKNLVFKKLNLKLFIVNLIYGNSCSE